MPFVYADQVASAAAAVQRLNLGLLIFAAALFITAVFVVFLGQVAEYALKARKPAAGTDDD